MASSFFDSPISLLAVALLVGLTQPSKDATNLDALVALAGLLAMVLSLGRSHSWTS